VAEVFRGPNVVKTDFRLRPQTIEEVGPVSPQCQEDQSHKLTDGTDDTPCVLIVSRFREEVSSRQLNCDVMNRRPRFTDCFICR